MEPAYISKNLTEDYYPYSTNPDFKEYFVIYNRLYEKQDIGELCDVNMSGDYLEESVIIGGIKERGQREQFIHINKCTADPTPNNKIINYQPIPSDLIDNLNNLPDHIRVLLNSKNVLSEKIKDINNS